MVSIVTENEIQIMRIQRMTVHIITKFSFKQPRAWPLDGIRTDAPSDHKSDWVETQNEVVKEEKRLRSRQPTIWKIP